MNFRNIALITLLLPVANYGKSTEIRIKELKEAQFQKELELSNLGEMITKRDMVLSSFTEESQYLLKSLVKRKKAKLEANNYDKKLSEDETNQLAIELRNEVNEFLYVVYAASQGESNIDGIITNGIFHEDSVEGNKELESLKFFLIKCAFERELTIKLVKKYEVCIQELSKINQELISLTQ